ncbi:hypothetical protein SY86_01820 [Erwinia tracheiphila]|uniref:Uncharacterized protein n=1 Tax=Erwinia tracheiphila TaxID=65700 RepID=A0A0M2KBW2_9GAMM|nr:hypothetical protein ETR_18996 [Erwinia tracheiphila PSU-1]KKF34481.1 hypothetical protein SY86_01820 [Erwinia tracheiphila]
MAGFVFRDKRSDFVPELIANLPFTACHTLPSDMTGMHYTMTPFGTGFYMLRIILYACLSGVLAMLNFNLAVKQAV